MMTGPNIKRLREQFGEKGLTQTELAAKIVGAHQQSVSQWENNKGRPTYEQAVEMMKLFQVPISEICDEYKMHPNQVIPEPGSASIKKETALAYIDWNQQNGNKNLKWTIITLACVLLGLIVCELGKYGVPAIAVLMIYIIIMILAFYFSKKIGLKKEEAAFSAIETGNFHLDVEAEKMVKQRKRQVKDSAQTTSNLGACGLILLLLWFIDAAYDASWNFSSEIVIIYLTGLGIILSLTSPTLNYWFAIKKLLNESAPRILTPFEKAFWRKK